MNFRTSLNHTSELLLELFDNPISEKILINMAINDSIIWMLLTEKIGLLPENQRLDKYKIIFKKLRSFSEAKRWLRIDEMKNFKKSLNSLISELDREIKFSK